MDILGKHSQANFDKEICSLCYVPKIGQPWLRAASTLFLLLGVLPGVSGFALETIAESNSETTSTAPNSMAQLSDAPVGTAQLMDAPAGAALLTKGRLEGKSRGVLRLGARASLGVASNAYVWGSRDHEATSTASGEASLGYDVYTVRARLAASKVMKKTEEWQWAEDFKTTLSRQGWRLSRDFKLSPSISFLLPTTENSRKYSLLNEGVGGALSLDWGLGHSIRGLSLKCTLSGTRYDYETPVAFDGRSNERWRTSGRLAASWEFIKNFSIDAMFGRTWAWTVKGNRKDKFEMDQSFSWSPTQVTSVSIGHNRGGSVLRSDGNSNLALYDSRDSSFYFSLDLEI